MIEGVRTEKLKVFSDQRGRVMQMLRCDSKLFAGFGEIYFSTVNPGLVKAWKKHLRMTQHFAVPRGKIRLVIYDDRENSASRGAIQEIDTGEDNYMLIRIPPRLWYGFKAEGQETALIANCTDMPHDPEECLRREAEDKTVPYKW